MRIANFVQLMLVAVFGFLVTNPAMPEDSKDYVVMARAAWSAFECSSLASKSKNPKEQERLFLFGYDQGHRFIAALAAQKVTREDLSTEAPLSFLLLLEGPTADFMLGRIFEAAQKSALEGAHKSGKSFNSEEMQEAIAKNKFWKLNCQLIGNQK